MISVSVQEHTTTNVQANARTIEAILFASGEPVTRDRLFGVLGLEEDELNHAIAELEALYNDGERGIRLVSMESSLQLCSAPKYADIIRRTLETRKTQPLSPPALEVLSIIAYFGPVTRAYVERVRGVDSSYTVTMLRNREFIEPCGFLDVPGRPTLFQTTKTFLRAFGLTSLDELPPLPETELEGEKQLELRNAISALQTGDQTAANDADAETIHESPVTEEE